MTFPVSQAVAGWNKFTFIRLDPFDADLTYQPGEFWLYPEDIEKIATDPFSVRIPRENVWFYDPAARW